MAATLLAQIWWHAWQSSANMGVAQLRATHWPHARLPEVLSALERRDMVKLSVLGYAVMDHTSKLWVRMPSHFTLIRWCGADGAAVLAHQHCLLQW